MSTTRTTRRTAVACTAAALVAAGLVASGSQASSSPKAPAPPTLNRMEHEARRHLPEVRLEQAQILNPREHHAHADVDETAPASSSAEPTPTGPCAVRLAQAWSDLGHFSDGYESYLLHQPPCI